MGKRDSIELQLQRSSLGTEGVRLLRQRTPLAITKRILGKAGLFELISPPVEVDAGFSRTAVYTSNENKQKEIGMSKKSRHVVPNPGGGWDVKKPGGQRASVHKRTQADAETRAKEILRKEGGGEVVIHDRQGRIRDKDTVTPGNDPNPPRDRRH